MNQIDKVFLKKWLVSEIDVARQEILLRVKSGWFVEAEICKLKINIYSVLLDKVEKGYFNYRKEGGKEE